MILPGRLFYTLGEAAERWGKTEDDLLHWAAAGKMKLCVNLDGITPEAGGQSLFTGWVDLVLPKEISGFLPSNETAHFSTFHHYGKPDSDVFRLRKNTGEVFFVPFERAEVAVRGVEVSRMEEEHSELLPAGVSFADRTDGKLAALLNPDHPWHSEPLASAVRAWLELYSKREGDRHDNAYRPIEGNTAYIEKWLIDNVDKNMGKTTSGHYCFVINPSKQGGPKKS
jgi:hypothetical protein